MEEYPLMKGDSVNANEFIEALNALAQERRINKELLFGAIEAALVSAYKRNYNTAANKAYTNALKFLSEYFDWQKNTNCRPLRCSLT